MTDNGIRLLSLFCVNDCANFKQSCVTSNHVAFFWRLSRRTHACRPTGANKLPENQQTILFCLMGFFLGLSMHEWQPYEFELIANVCYQLGRARIISEKLQIWIRNPVVCYARVCNLHSLLYGSGTCNQSLSMVQWCKFFQYAISYEKFVWKFVFNQWIDHEIIIIKVGCLTTNCMRNDCRV